jgi:hypothetical protein
MFPTVVIVLLVLAATAWWLRGATGRSAVSLCFKHPRLFAPAAVLFAVDLLTSFVPEAFAAPFFQTSLAGIALTLSLPFLAMIAARVLCVAWLIGELGQAIHERPMTVNSLVLPVFAVLAIGWVAIFASLALVMAAGATGLFLPVLLGWAAGLFWFNSRLAPLVPALLVAGDGARVVRAKAVELFAASPGRWRAAVAVHLLVLGLVTFVWLDGYTTVADGRYETVNSTNFKVNAQYVLSLSLDTNWPNDIASVLKATVPAPLSYFLRVVMAVLGTVFMAAYAVIGQECPRA